MKKLPKYMLKSNLSEKQIEADVATYMGWCTPNHRRYPFRLLDVNEQITGADKKYDVACVIYMQFKKSLGLVSASTIAPSLRKGRSPLEGIREFRETHGLESDPTLYFQLRAKSKTATDLQHNILMSYENPPWSRAIYVAPLVLDKDHYNRIFFDYTVRYLEDPFYYRLRHSINTFNWKSYFGSVPCLREHISIPPHERVADHNHYYAYSESGVDISWHSPSIVDREPSRLSDFMGNFFANALNNKEGMMPVERAASQILQTARDFGFSDSGYVENSAPLKILQRHGLWLREVHGIRQFVLVGQSNEMTGNDDDS